MARGVWTSCTVAHYDGEGNPVPCPDMEPTVADPRIPAAYCECGDGYPSHGIGKYKHLPSCRYGIIEDFLPPLGEDLGAAWASAEAALPEGSLMEVRRHPGGSEADRYCVTYRASVFADGIIECDGPTPAAALLALAERLKENA